MKPGAPARGQEVMQLVHLRKVIRAARCVGGGGPGCKVGTSATRTLRRGCSRFYCEYENEGRYGTARGKWEEKP